MPRTAMATVVVAHARPFVCPSRITAIANVVVAVPSHSGLRKISPASANDNILGLRNPDNLDLSRIEAVVESLA